MSKHITAPEVGAPEPNVSASPPKKKKEDDVRTNIALKQQQPKEIVDDDNDNDQQGYIHSQEASPTMAELETVRVTDGPQRKVHRK